MADHFVKATAQADRKTTPAGMAILGTWTFGVVIKVGTVDTSNGNGLFRLGPQGDTSTRGLIYRIKDSRTVGVYDGHTNLAGTTPLANGTTYILGLMRDAATGKYSIGVNGVEENFDTSGTNPTEIQAGDVFQLSDNDGALGLSWGDFDLCWPVWIQGVKLTHAQLAAYYNQTGGKTIASFKADFGPSGAITANALKEFLSLGTATPHTDLSGVGNDVTPINAPTNAAQLLGLPEGLGATFSDGISESMSLADGVSMTLSAVASVSEAIALTDSVRAITRIASRLKGTAHRTS